MNTIRESGSHEVKKQLLRLGMVAGVVAFLGVESYALAEDSSSMTEKKEPVEQISRHNKKHRKEPRLIADCRLVTAGAPAPAPSPSPSPSPTPSASPTASASVSDIQDEVWENAAPADYRIILTNEPHNGSMISANTYRLNSKGKIVDQVGHAEVAMEATNASGPVEFKSSSESPFPFELSISEDAGKHGRRKGTLVTSELFKSNTLSNRDAECRFRP